MTAFTYARELAERVGSVYRAVSERLPFTYAQDIATGRMTPAGQNDLESVLQHDGSRIVGIHVRGGDPAGAVADAALDNDLWLDADDEQDVVVWQKIDGVWLRIFNATMETADAALAAARAAQARIDALDIQVDGVEPNQSFIWDDADIVVSHSPWLHSINGVEPGDLVVLHWMDFRAFEHAFEHILPGSTDAEGRMYFRVSDLTTTFALGIGKSLNINRLVSDGSADTLNSRVELFMERSGNGLVVKLEIDVSGNANNVNMKPAPGFELQVDIYRNTSVEDATIHSLGGRIAELTKQVTDLEAGGFRKGRAIASITGLAGGGLDGADWSIADAANSEAQSSSGGGLSDYLRMHVLHYAQSTWGVIAEVTRTGVSGPVSRVYIPWSMFWEVSGTRIFVGYWIDAVDDNDGNVNQKRVQGVVEMHAGRLIIRVQCDAADADGTLTFYEAV